MTRELPTFKAGQKWRTRGGNVVTVAYVVAPLSDQAYIVTTDEGCSYTPKGHYHISEQEHYLDLVTLVSDGDVNLAVEKATTTPNGTVGVADDSYRRIEPDQQIEMFNEPALTVNDMHITGYETLADVLQRAYNQAAVGKGVERHSADGEPFHEQVMQIGAAKFGVGSLLFQAFKKSEESQRLPHDRAINELLGAINYLAGAVIALEIKRDTQA